MTGRRAVVALLVVAAIVWIVVARTGGHSSSTSTTDRPTHLVEVRATDIVAVDVRAPATSKQATLTGSALDGVRDDLAPLLAIRLLPARDQAFGLDPPVMEVVVHTARDSFRVDVGVANFDRTGVYAAVGDRTATILPSLVDRLGAAVGLAPVSP
jgi:hypothetical protein